MDVEPFVAARIRRAAPFVLSVVRFAGVASLACTLCGTLADAAEMPDRKPKYGSKAVRMYHARDYLRAHDAPDFWALMPYYVHQFSERACSVASATMVVNAARAHSNLSASDELLTQKALLRKVSYPRWTDAIQPGGRGVTIEDLGRYLNEALNEYAGDKYEVEAVRIRSNDSALRERIRRMLVENERSDDDFVVVFFWQATFTDDPEGRAGHVAPLGAYDTENERVLVLDPDRDWYEPYWVPLDVLVEGMARKDQETGLSRGYIWVRKVDKIAADGGSELK